MLNVLLHKWVSEISTNEPFHKIYGITCVAIRLILGGIADEAMLVLHIIEGHIRCSGALAQVIGNNLKIAVPESPDTRV